MSAGLCIRQARFALAQRRLRPLAFGDVAKIPYPAIVFPAFAEHRGRITVKRSAIFQGNLILAYFIPVLVELFQLADEFPGAYQFIHHRLQDLLIGFGVRYGRRNIP